MTTWATRQQSSVTLEVCGDAWAVHLDGNGMTHLVDSVSAEVLLFVANSPRAIGDIRSQVALLAGAPDISEAEVVEGFLLPLEAVGLLEVVAP